MKRVLLIGLLAALAVSMTMAVPSYSRAHGGWGAGWFVGGLALGTALGFAQGPLLLPAALLSTRRLPTPIPRRRRPMHIRLPTLSQPAPAYAARRSLPSAPKRPG